MGNLENRITIRLDDELDAAVNRSALKRHTKPVSVVREALHQYLLENDPIYRAQHEQALKAAEEPKPYEAKGK